MSDTTEMEDKSEVSTDISGGRDLKIEETEFVDTNIKLELMEDSDRFVHQYQSDAQDQYPQKRSENFPCPQSGYKATMPAQMKQHVAVRHQNFREIKYSFLNSFLIK